jgi:hypothetical protein
MIESGVPKNGWRFMSLADNQGRDTLERWFDKEIDQGRRKGVETAIKTTLRFLRFARKDLWKRPHFQWFSGGIGEVRSDYGNIEYRPLGCNGPEPDQFTVLLGAYKKGKVWSPRDARKTAARLRKDLASAPDRGNRYEIRL